MRVTCFAEVSFRLLFEVGLAVDGKLNDRGVTLAFLRLVPIFGLLKSLASRSA